MSKPANRFGRCFERRKELIDLEKLKDLKPGDHVARESVIGLYITFWHHMIVESTDLSNGTIDVIHYYHDLNPLLKRTSVCRTSFTFEPDTLYRIVYEDNECCPPSKVLLKAKARLGETHYCPVLYNCEHFANECKTGVNKCYQIWTGIEILAKSLASTIAKAKDKTKSKVRLPFFVASVIETVLLSWDIYVAKSMFDKGKMTREEFCEVIVKRLCAAILSIPGILLGMSFPYLGVLGTFLGGAVCDFLSKVLAGHYLGGLLTPLVKEYLMPAIFESKEKKL